MAELSKKMMGGMAALIVGILVLAFPEFLRWIVGLALVLAGIYLIVEELR